jgi:spore germination protein KB
MNEMELSGRQIFWMMVSMQVIMTILLTTAPALQIAGPDAWMSAILASGVGAGIAYLCAQLNLMFPNQTLIEYSRHLLGKWLGGFVSVLYLLYDLLLLAVILKQFSLFITGTIMPRTPISVVAILMILCVLYPTLYGIAVLGRLCEISGPLILIGIVGPIFLVINQMEPDRILPILADSGLVAMMKGSLPIATFLGDCVMLVMLTAFVSDSKRIVKQAVGGVAVCGFFSVLLVMVSLFVFGSNVAAGYPYPLLMMVRTISLGGIIENLDAIVVTIWIMSIFTKLALYLFVAGYGTSQLFGIKKWKTMIWILALLVMITSFLPINYIEISVLFPQKIGTGILFPYIMVGVPLVMFIVAKLRGKKRAAL